MSQKLDAPKMPAGTYPELSPNPNSEGLKLKDGGRGTPVVVTTEPRKSNTNTITVDEVKRLIREGIDHFEKEEGGVTEKELQAALAVKANKIGGLSYYEVESSDNAVEFGKKHKSEAVIIRVKDSNAYYIGRVYVTTVASKDYLSFELENMMNQQRFVAENLQTSSTSFLVIFNPIYYRHDYALVDAVDKCCKIVSFEEGHRLTDLLWQTMKTGDILKVNNMQFIINVFETTGENAYKGVTGTMVGAVTANSITIASIDWRTVGEGYIELEPTLTTLTIGGNE